jgi:hypothetical protein
MPRAPIGNKELNEMHNRQITRAHNEGMEVFQCQHGWEFQAWTTPNRGWKHGRLAEGEATCEWTKIGTVKGLGRTPTAKVVRTSEAVG